MRFVKIFIAVFFAVSAGICGAEDSGVLFDLSVKDGKISAEPAKCQFNGDKKSMTVEAPVLKKQVIQLNADGRTNEYIRVYSKAIQNDGKPLNRAFTVEVKFKPVDIFKAQQLVHKLVWWSKSGYGDGAFSVGFKNAVPYVAIWTFSDKLKKGRKLEVCSGGQLVPDAWNSIAAVFDGQKVTLYVNGTKCAEKTIPDGVFPYSKYDKLGSFIIGGGCYTGRDHFNGMIDRIRVRNKASEDFFFKPGEPGAVAVQPEKLETGRNFFKSDDIIGIIRERPGSYKTSLKDAVVVAPADEKSQLLAGKIAKQLNIPLIKADEAVVGRCRGLTEKCLNADLILLGNINNNAAIVPLYARFLSWADAEYPGKGGYAIRTIRNPYGMARNNILLAASDYSGLEKAVDAFLASPQLDAAAGKCGYMFDIKPVLPQDAAEEINKLLRKTGEFIKKGAEDNTGVVVGQFAVAYYLTGNKQFEASLKAYAENVTAKTGPVFVRGHYYWENLLRAVEIITNTDIVSAETVRKLDINLFLSLYKMRGDYGIRRNQQLPGGRHQLPPTCAYMMFCDILRRNLTPETSLNVRNFIEANYKSTSAYFKNLSLRTYSGSDDSSSTAANMTSLMQAAFFLGDTTLFENGLAREGAKKMICITDNRGYGAGTGTYEDAYEEGMTKKPYYNGGPLCYTAFYYNDPGLKWVKENVKGMSFSSWFARTWFGLHKYATGDYLQAEKPDGKYMSTFCRPRPITLEKYQETKAFPKNMLFDKAVIRSGSDPADAYICFQGNGSGKEGLWDTASDTLVLLRYVDKGVLWLANNTQLNGAAWRNSFIVSDSSTDSSGGYPFARLDFLGKVNGYDAFAASVNNVRGGVWTRRAVYLGNGRLFVADTFQAGRAGDYSFLQTFKSPVPAEIHDGKVIALKSGFRMTATGTGKGIISMDNGIRRMEPQRFWYFRKSYDRSMKAGDKITLATLFTVTSLDEDRASAPVELSPESFCLKDKDKFLNISFSRDKFSIEKTDLCPTGLQETTATRLQPSKIKKLVEIADNFAMVPQKLRGWKVISPKLAEAHVLDDNVVKRWDAGCGYDGKQPLVIDLMRLSDTGGIGFCGYTFKHQGQPKSAADIKLTVEAADNSEFTAAVKQDIILKHAPDMRELYKMGAWQVQRYEGQMTFKKVRYLRITGLPDRLAEMFIYSDGRVPAGIKKMKTADLDGDGVKELLVETLDCRITAFNRKGRQLFSIKVPFEIVDFIAADLNGDKKAEIIFPCFDLRLYKYDWQGKQVKVSEPLFQHPYTINILNDSNGSKKLAITFYYHHQFFNADLEPLNKPQGYGAMWTENAQPVDVNGDGMEDLVISDIYARGYTVDGHTGKVSKLFWAVDGIFNGIFPNGKSVDGQRKVIFAGTGKINCSKVGVGSSAQAVPEWTLFNGSQYSSAVMSGGNLFSTSFAGHISDVAPDGKLKRVLWPKGRIFAVAGTDAGIAAATDSGLKLFDASLRDAGFYPGIITGLVSDGAYLWALADGRILLLQK